MNLLRRILVQKPVTIHIRGPSLSGKKYAIHQLAHELDYTIVMLCTLDLVNHSMRDNIQTSSTLCTRLDNRHQLIVITDLHLLTDPTTLCYLRQLMYSKRRRLSNTFVLISLSTEYNFRLERLVRDIPTVDFTVVNVNVPNPIESTTLFESLRLLLVHTISTAFILHELERHDRSKIIDRLQFNLPCDRNTSILNQLTINTEYLDNYSTYDTYHGRETAELTISYLPSYIMSGRRLHTTRRRFIDKPYTRQLQKKKTQIDSSLRTMSTRLGLSRMECIDRIDFGQFIAHGNGREFIPMINGTMEENYHARLNISKFEP